MSPRALLWLGLGLVAAGLVSLMVGSVASPARPLGPGAVAFGTLRDPGSPGFVAGTASTPRIVGIVAMPQLRFAPEAVVVRRGETITFQVTTLGPITHEFMVGPAADVAANRPGTPEIANIGMMETRSVTFTFDGSGPYAFACHAPGHYEAGMAGTIVVVP